MKALVINLDSRTDRWSDATKQAHLFPEGITRISAFEAKLIATTDLTFVPSGVVATWKSHLLAYSTFLKSSTDSHCLILEDDFVIGQETQFLRSLTLSSHFDFFQLGFLTPHPSDFAYRVVWDLQSLALQAFALAAKLHPLKNLSIFKSKSVLDAATTPRNTVLHDIHAGGHAYIVSRKFATHALEINNPVFLSTDGVFMALAKSRAFKMGRVRTSLVGQSGSPSSVIHRFID